MYRCVQILTWLSMIAQGNITSYFITQCQSKTNCTFTASNTNVAGGDPCSGTYKYTNVSYLCV